jgi:hypothetical protein
MKIFQWQACWLVEMHRTCEYNLTAQQVRALSVVHWKLYGEVESRK